MINHVSFGNMPNIGFHLCTAVHENVLSGLHGYLAAVPAVATGKVSLRHHVAI